MSMIVHKVNGTDYTFFCSSRSTRTGFAHDCTLYAGCSGLGKASCHYLNRTWECYRYQSVMQKAVRDLIIEYEQAAVRAFKQERGLSRLSAKRRPELEEFKANRRNLTPTWNDLVLLYGML